MGPTPPMLFTESVYQSFRPVAQFIFLVKVQFFLVLFLKYRKGVLPYRHAYNVPLILYIQVKVKIFL